MKYVNSYKTLIDSLEKVKVVFDVVVNPRQIHNIERFIRYIEAYPFRYKVYRIIPIELSFIFIFINICITYFIVVIQLTHLY
ncbi:uncharacterized protein [Epargyreus clarus]|uniref:uncharacterized protein n=1 Tax=Epargyreus clarus TaxID=520877 RepID=UPI003C30C0E4